MKKWTGVLISLLVLILIAYFIMGFLVQRTLNKNINAFHNTSMLSVHLDKYQRGWFSSQAVLAIKMHIPEQKTTDKNGITTTNPPVDLNLDFPLIINHGPFICTDSGIRFGLGHVTTRPQTHFHALVNYLNNTQFRYSLPSFSMNGKAGPEDFQFEWLGLTSLFSISPNVDKFKGDLTLYGFNGTANNITFKSAEVFNKFKFSYTQGLWLGQTHFSIPSVSATMGDTKAFELEAFDLDLSTDINNNLLNYNSSITLNKLFVDGNNYGPGAFKLSIKNLDPAAMADINKLEWTMLENNQNPELNMLALLAELPKLLSKGSVLELSEMYLTVPEGKITGSLKITLPQNNVNDPAQIMQKAHGEGQFRAPMATVKELLVETIDSDVDDNDDDATPSTTDTSTTDTSTTNTTNTSNTTNSSTTTNTATPVNETTDPAAQADAILKNYVTKGLLKVEGNDYVVDIKFDNQQLFVNGKPFSKDMLN